jgi:hypothetical protein
LAALGVRNVQIAEPLAAFGTPLSRIMPTEPAQATRLGRIAAPPAVTRTVAATVAPALGFA